MLDSLLASVEGGAQLSILSIVHNDAAGGAKRCSVPSLPSWSNDIRTPHHPGSQEEPPRRA